MIRDLKEFRIYIFHSHVIAYGPSTTIKDVLTRSYLDGRREKWIAVLLEYDLEIKPTKLIKGKGLEKLMAHSTFASVIRDASNFIAISNASTYKVIFCYINDSFM